VATIINKHVSLQIQPEHYPIVGASLLKAIREVLGAEVATDDVLAMGRSLWPAGRYPDRCGRADLSAERGRGRRLARCTPVQGGAKTVESERSLPSCWCRPMAAGSAHQPGQYIGLEVEVAGSPLRQYSLSAEANGGDYRISVKREAGGVVSNHLHDQLQSAPACRCFRQRATLC
jgi:nitric oxide dioxygenase